MAIIANVSDLNEGLKSRLVLNQCQPNTTLTQETLEVLPEFGIELAKAQLRHRQVYRQSAVFGQTVHDFGGKASAAIEEMETLTSEVFKILG